MAPAKRGRPATRKTDANNKRARLDDVQPAPVQQAAPVQAPVQPAPVQQAAPVQAPVQPAPVQQAAPVQAPAAVQAPDFIRVSHADMTSLHAYGNQMPYGVYAQYPSLPVYTHPMSQPVYNQAQPSMQFVQAQPGMQFVQAQPSMQFVQAQPITPVIQPPAATSPAQQQQGWSQGFWDFMRTLLWLAFLCFCLYGLVIGAPKMIEETLTTVSKLLSKTVPSAPATSFPARGGFVTEKPSMMHLDLSAVTSPADDKTGNPSQTKSWAERFAAMNFTNMFHKSSAKPVPPALPEPQAVQPLQELPVIPAQPEPPVMPAPMAKPVILEPPVVQAQPEPPVVQAQPEPPVVQAQPEPPVVQAQPEPPVVQAQPEPPVNTTQPEPPVNTTQPEPQVNKTQPELPVNTTQPEPPVVQVQYVDDGSITLEFD